MQSVDCWDSGIERVGEREVLEHTAVSTQLSKMEDPSTQVSCSRFEHTVIMLVHK